MVTGEDQNSLHRSIGLAAVKVASFTGLAWRAAAQNHSAASPLSSCGRAPCLFRPGTVWPIIRVYPSWCRNHRGLIRAQQVIAHMPINLDGTGVTVPVAAPRE